jgi:uncharacterized glyoxalase superfamily protein PhnB
MQQIRTAKSRRHVSRVVGNADLCRQYESRLLKVMFRILLEWGLEIAYPLTDEPWGVRRFFVVDPSGTVLNIMSHIPS